MKCGLLIAVAAATIVAGAAGCSNDNKSASPSSSSATSTSATTSSTSAAASSSTPAAAPGETKVTVGGQVQPVSGPVECSTNGGKFSIAVGDMLTGIIIGLEPDGAVVHNAGLGTVNGRVMSFTEGAPDNNATATKNGNTYHITGNATGSDNSGQLVSQQFTVDVTCP